MPNARTVCDLPGVFVLLMVAVVVLCGLSIAIQNAPARYAVATALPGLAAAGDLQQWRPSRTGANVVERQPRTVRLESQGSRELVYVYRNLAGLAAAEHLRVSAEIRGEGLAGGLIDGGAGQLVATPLDSENRRVRHWPGRVGGLEGDSGWRRVSLVVPTAGRVNALQLVAFVAAGRGWMEIREPRVEAVSEQPVFRLARYLVIAGWLLLALALVAWMVRAGPRRLPRIALAAVSCVAIAMALASPPLVEGSLKRLLVGGQDLLYDVADLLRAPPSRPTLAGGESAGATGVEEAPAPAVATTDPATAGAGASADGDGKPDSDSDAGEQASGKQAAATEGAVAAAGERVAAREYWMPPRRNLDKRAHLAGFAALALLAAFAFTSARAWWLLPPLVLMALAVEVLQGFTVMREPSLLDLVAGVAGAALGVLLAWLFAALLGRWRGLAAHGL